MGGGEDCPTGLGEEGRTVLQGMERRGGLSNNRL